MILISILTQTRMRSVEGVFKVIMVIFLLFVQLSLHQFVFFRLIYERWPYECLTVLTVDMIRGRNRRRGGIARSPYACSVPRQVES